MFVLVHNCRPSTRCIRALSTASSLFDYVSVRSEVDEAINIVEADGDCATERALEAFTKNAESDQNAPPAFQLAQIFSARAMKMLQENVLPKHTMCHEMLAAAR